MTMDNHQIETQIQTFLAKTFMIDFEKKAARDTDLFEAGLIDSYGFIDLVAFIEQTFSVSMSDDDLASPEMSSLAGIARMVASRKAA